jgi:hypothetical protein
MTLVFEVCHFALVCCYSLADPITTILSMRPKINVPNFQLFLCDRIPHMAKRVKKLFDLVRF